MTDVALIAVDLDGTLLTSSKALAPAGARLLREAVLRGVHVVIATTRNPETAFAYARELGTTSPVICTNGGQVFASPGGPRWAYHTIPMAVGLAIAQLADNRGWELSISVGGTNYWRRRPDQQPGPLNPHVTIVASNVQGLVGEPVRILAAQPEAMTALRALVEERFAAQCRTETYLWPDGAPEMLGIFPARADKGTALALVMERLGLPPERALAIGDNNNDLPMFAVAGLSVAMGNARDEVKQRATSVAPSHDHEGVAWAVRRFVLEA